MCALPWSVGNYEQSLILVHMLLGMQYAVVSRLFSWQAYFGISWVQAKISGWWMVRGIHILAQPGKWSQVLLISYRY